MRIRHVLLACSSAALISACGDSQLPGSVASEEPIAPIVDTLNGPVPKAFCGPGSQPETDIQGRVSQEDRVSGRSQEGYWCNMELVGQYQGEGASWQVAWYDDCAYFDTQTGGPGASSPGVQVIDVSDPTNPVLTANLTTTAMLDPWESLKVNEPRGLLGGVHAQNASGPLFFDLYDVSGDCTQPVLQASAPVLPAGHEGDFAPDGMTYYGSSTFTESTVAIDITDPTNPTPIMDLANLSHGLGISDDGNRVYLTDLLGTSCEGTGTSGLKIVDSSQIQARALLPQAPTISNLCWTDGQLAQHAIPVTMQGKPHLIFVDEGGLGAARIIDISDETAPFIVSKMKLEIHMPEYDAERSADTANNGTFGYEGHYCGVDRKVEPTIVGCGYFQSGVRFFDIRDPYQPKEIAYYNPPAQVGKRADLPGSQHANGVTGSGGGTTDLTADWCSAQVRFIPERAEAWTTCQDNGLLILRFTNGVWPFEE